MVEKNSTYLATKLKEIREDIFERKRSSILSHVFWPNCRKRLHNLPVNVILLDLYHNKWRPEAEFSKIGQQVAGKLTVRCVIDYIYDTENSQ